jgi:tripartite-type tricarboxylate transporter receptor subunit TctC
LTARAADTLEGGRSIVKQGKLRAPAVTRKMRLADLPADLPDVPTVAEAEGVSFSPHRVLRSWRSPVAVASIDSDA